MMRLVSTLLLYLGMAAGAFAHSQSYGYLTLTVNGGVTSGKVELAVRDADLLLALDSDGDGEIVWREVAARENDIASRLLAGVSVTRGDDICHLSPRPLMIDSHGGETYLVAPFNGTCSGQAPLAVGYDLMFDRDAQHRGLVKASVDGDTQSFVLSPDNRSFTVATREDAVGQFLSFTAHGVHHIWIGYDHILFLVTLLLATVLGTRGQGLRRGLAEATKVVTAFTASHSITLALAATGLVSVPAAITESLIALTIALAAANNIWPVVTTRVWLLALAFGLVHGLGFANVLGDLGLARGNLLPSLLAFNVGVELGQLAIVAAALPLIHAIATPHLGWKALPAANAFIIAVGLAWFSDRALGTELMPF